MGYDRVAKDGASPLFSRVAAAARAAALHTFRAQRRIDSATFHQDQLAIEELQRQIRESRRDDEA